MKPFDDPAASGATQPAQEAPMPDAAPTPAPTPAAPVVAVPPKSLRVVTFNVNQFDKPAKVTQDLAARIVGADVVLVQEAVNFDLARFARKHDGWAAHQVDGGENNGHANTAVLYRPENGPVEDTVCIFVGQAKRRIVGKAKATRARYLIGIKQAGVWLIALHIFPARDQALVPAQLKVAGAWARDHEGEPQVWGLDRNKATVASLEAATALTWYGGTADPLGGILTNLKVSKPHEFPKGFSDHRGFAVTVAVPAAKPKPRPWVYHRPPYVGPTSNVMHSPDGTPWTNLPITRATMHCTVGSDAPGARFGVARLFKKPGLFASAHFVVDPAGTVQVVFENQVAEHAPPNPGSIGIEICDPLISEAWDLTHAGRWQDAPHQAMLHRAADVVAHLCLTYDLPVRHLTVGQVKQNQRGICGHVDVSDAFHETDHWDPGPAFPWEQFLGMVERRVHRFKAAAA